MKKFILIALCTISSVLHSSVSVQAQTGEFWLDPVTQDLMRGERTVVPFSKIQEFNECVLAINQMATLPHHIKQAKQQALFYGAAAVAVTGLNLGAGYAVSYIHNNIARVSSKLAFMVTASLVPGMALSSGALQVMALNIGGDSVESYERYEEYKSRLAKHRNLYETMVPEDVKEFCKEMNLSDYTALQAVLDRIFTAEQIRALYCTKYSEHRPVRREFESCSNYTKLLSQMHKTKTGVQIKDWYQEQGVRELQAVSALHTQGRRDINFAHELMILLGHVESAREKSIEKQVPNLELLPTEKFTQTEF
jgi:hypothetical protein